MVKIEAIVQPVVLDSVKAELDRLGIQNVTFSQVLAHGGPFGPKVVYRGAEYHVDTPKTKIEILVSSFAVDDVVDALTRSARTGLQVDDGTILLYEVADAIKIRNGERVQFSLS